MTSRNYRWGSSSAGMRGLLFPVLAAVFASAAVDWAGAAEPRWPSGQYRYIAVNQPVKDALEEFGRNIGVQVEVSDQVKGEVGPGLPLGTARQFLEELASRYGLVWHYDGLVLHVAAESEMASELIPLDVDAGEDAAQRLERLNVTDPRFPTTVSVEDDVLSVQGPPSYIAQIKKTLGLTTRPKPSGIVNVRVFRGRQAQSENLPQSQANTQTQGQSAQPQSSGNP